ncbi:MAG TPA: UbiA-like polyprenyltransferase [Candidatus Deferrimicrobium sp.]|nr:UbiA-like polyprenyltransferase [Candidatus Deferrimicrobium sp.]
MSKFKVFMEMIKFEHTIFALPFAFLGTFLGARYLQPQGWPTWSQLFWVTMAMVGARTAAMALNRLIDRHIDAKNPRTAVRAIPKGLLKTGEVYLYIILSFALLAVSAYQLNMLCLELMPIAVFFLTLYSYTKRFTWACHLILGIADGLAPLGGWIAITGSFDYQGVLLGLLVGTWIAGFDIIYSCQDSDFDKSLGLHSIPTRFGIAKALQISIWLHVLTALLFVAVGIVLNLGLFYYLGVLVALVILYKQHTMVAPDDLSKLNFAFFNMNGYLSLIVFAFTLLELVFPIRIM